MTTRKIIAATILSLLGGAAIASERQIDYTNEHLTMTRAEVVAETRAFNAMHQEILAHSNEAYGRTDDLASTWTSGDDAATIAGSSSGEIRANEAYGGFPAVDDRLSRGE